jgi:hypothetical protein
VHVDEHRERTIAARLIDARKQPEVAVADVLNVEDIEIELAFGTQIW